MFLPLIWLALSLSLATARAAVDCDPGTYSNSINRVLHQSCEMAVKAADCDALARTDEAIKANQRDCHAEKDELRRTADTIGGCAAGAAGVTVDLFKEIAGGVASFYGTFAQDAAARARAIEACWTSTECRAKVEAHSGAPPTNTVSRDDFAKQWMLAERRNSIDRVELQRQALGLQRDLITRGIRPNTPEYEAALKSAPPAVAEYQRKTTDAATHVATPVVDMVLAKAKQLYAHTQCLNQEAAAELTCYSVVAIVAPNAAAGYLTKLTRLNRLIGGAGRAGEAAGGATRATGEATAAAEGSAVRTAAEPARANTVAPEVPTPREPVATAKSDAAPAAPTPPRAAGADLDSPARLKDAARVLNRQLNPAERQAVLEAHEVGRGKPGRDGTPASVRNYTKPQLLSKARILEKAGFTEAERRVLMEKEIVGLAANQAPVGQGAIVFFRTQSGKVRQGIVQELRYDWKANDYVADVYFDDPTTGVRKQTTLAADSMANSPSLLKGGPVEAPAPAPPAAAAFDPASLRHGDQPIAFNTGGQRIAGHVTAARGGRLEVEFIENGQVDRRYLTPAEQATVKAGTLAGTPEYLKHYARSVFQGQAGYLGEAGNTLNVRKYRDVNGTLQRVEITNAPAYREAAVRQGKIREYDRPSNIPPGKYTYGVTEDGTLVTGKIDNTVEFGVKHSHLANGRKLMVAGEMEVDRYGRITYNTESGSYTRYIKEAGQATEGELRARAKLILRRVTGHEPDFTERLIWTDDVPDVRTLRSYCLDRWFAHLNPAICQTH